MDSDVPAVEMKAAEAGPFMSLQIIISNTVASIGLDEEETKALAGILCERAERWVRNVHQADCLERGKLPA
jgi:hypothetical protein